MPGFSATARAGVLAHVLRFKESEGGRILGLTLPSFYLYVEQSQIIGETMMKDARMNIAYDFEGDESGFEDKERYARQILDGDNEDYYGFGYCYEFDEFPHADEHEYFHDFDSYYRLIERLPALERLMDKNEFVGSDVVYF
jgi:hypothetical protein